MSTSSLVAQVMPPGRVHVLQVIGNAIVGGMETHVLQLVERLPRERFRVSAICPFESHLTEQLRTLGVETTVAPMPEEPLWSSIVTALALVRSGGIDVLHAHLPNAHMLAGLAGRLAGKPVLTTIHGRQLMPMDAEVHHATGSHLVLVCKQSWFHALGMGVPAGQASCIPNGVDCETYHPAPPGGDAAAQALRAEFGIPPEAPVVGFVGRLSPEKSPETFVRAMLLLKSLVPQAHGLMLGDGPLQPTIARSIEQMGLAGRVHLAGLRRDMPAAFRALDLLVSSSNTEAMPLAVMEGMASGLPVVATRVGGVPDLVEQGRSGWLVGPRDFEGMAQQVAQVLTTPGQREAMAERGRARALAQFNIVDSVERTAQLLERLAGALPRGLERPAAGRSRKAGEA